MSSFIVEDKIINKIVTKLAYDRDGYFVKRKVLEAGFNVDSLEGRQKLGWAMFALNVRAFNQRYKDKSADTFRSLSYQFKLERKYSKTHAFKALRCWLYQCTEGDTDETDLYKLMQEVSDIWAYDIVRGLPEYDQTKKWN